MRKLLHKVRNPLQRRNLRVSKYGLWIILTTLLLNSFTTLQSNTPQVKSNPVPVLAYYYIWFDTTSWDRAKTDFPLLGHYSSDNADVMRQHIKWAKSAGINGFIVSWKSTEKLNKRLEQLIQIANQENFKLVVIYQGLDFQRDPLAIKQIDSDFSYFIDHFADDPVFDLYEKPVLIWSGTWKFSRDEVESVVQGKGDHLLILASEKNVDGYQRIADLVDGDAYYWSSVNPDTFPSYPEKLAAMSDAIHSNGGIWIAPAAVGFDARKIGGTTVVERQDGKNLQTQFNVAIGSSPDAIGLISWNEFSENSQIEPSENYDKRYLNVLAKILHAPGPKVSDFDSSEPGGTLNVLGFGRTAALGLVGVLIILGLLIIIRRADH